MRGVSVELAYGDFREHTLCPYRTRALGNDGSRDKFKPHELEG